MWKCFIFSYISYRLVMCVCGGGTTCMLSKKRILLSELKPFSKKDFYRTWVKRCFFHDKDDFLRLSPSIIISFSCFRQVICLAPTNFHWEVKELTQSWPLGFYYSRFKLSAGNIRLERSLSKTWHYDGTIMISIPMNDFLCMVYIPATIPLL